MWAFISLQSVFVLFADNVSLFIYRNCFSNTDKRGIIVSIFGGAIFQLKRFANQKIQCLKSERGN